MWSMLCWENKEISADSGVIMPMVRESVEDYAAPPVPDA
jgi:hypothetical protein